MVMKITFLLHNDGQVHKYKIIDIYFYITKLEVDWKYCMYSIININFMHENISSSKYTLFNVQIPFFFSCFDTPSQFSPCIFEYFHESSFK